MQAVQVISLARTPQRRAAFAELNGHLHYEFRDAIDGSAMTMTDVAATGLFEEGLPYSMGAFGCAMSHLALWERAIETGQPVTVAEDDAIFRLDFHDQQTRLLERLAPDWDIVIWGWNLDSACWLNLLPGVSHTVVLASQASMVNAIENFQHGDTAPSLLRLDRCFGTPSYTISAAGARRFKARCFPIKRSQATYPLIHAPIENTGIDNAMSMIYWQRQAFASLPPMVVTKNEHESSTVQNGVYHPEVKNPLPASA